MCKRYEQHKKSAEKCFDDICYESGCDGGRWMELDKVDVQQRALALTMLSLRGFLHES